MYVQLQLTHGSVSLGADSTTPDALDFSTGPGAVGLGRIIWQGQSAGAPGTLSNPTGLNHLDLTDGGANTGIELTVGADHAATAVLTIYTDANDWSTATVAIAQNSDGTATQTVFVPFSSFAAGNGASGGATFTNVGAVQLDISGPAATDAQVTGIGAAGPTVLTQNFTNAAEADLAITKTGSPNPVDAGKPLVYTLTVVNNGPSTGTGVAVTDTLPAGVAYASSTASQGSASDSGNVVTVNMGTLADGATATVTITVDVASTTVGSITNTATVSSTSVDPVSSNNTATCTTTVNQQQHPTNVPTLTIVKTASAPTVSVGGTLVYTLTVGYTGDVTDTGVSVSDTLPTGETFASSVTTSQGTASVVGNQITVSLGSMANGGFATITIPVRITSSVSSVTNTAIATDALQDRVQSTVTTPVLSSPSKRMFLGR